MEEIARNQQRKCLLFHDNFQNYKRYDIPKAQLVIADIPYNVSGYAYASSPEWYEGGDRRKGESKLAKKSFFPTDEDFRVPEFMAFCSRMVKKEGSGEPGCMVVFCSFEQQWPLIEIARENGFLKYQPLTFVKGYSPQVLKANMRVVGATERALVLWRDKLPKFRNDGRMVFDWFPYERDGKSVPQIHPTQKPLSLLKRLITVFTDQGDVVIDPCAGSASSLRAAYETGRESYGFEVDRSFYEKASKEMLSQMSVPLIQQTNPRSSEYVQPQML